MSHDEMVLQTLLANETLDKAIDAILSRFYTVSDTQLYRISRGEVHSLVSKELGIELNNQLCLKIRSRVQSKGAQPYISRGRLYYKHLVKKAS